ncbi:MAG: hypothetical protein GYB67_18420 [Chloroflexi bacterium]|nr:hypothetical protein [Chloroflexota bacterium]
MTQLAPLTQEEVSTAVHEWYEKLDVHVPMVDILPMLVTEGLTQQWPEVTVTDLAGFEEWYQRVIRTFFDELHTIQELNITVAPDGQKADIKLVVYWEASAWTPGDRNSKRLMMDAHQTWEVVRSAQTGKPAIKTIIVDKIVEREGSASL